MNAWQKVELSRHSERPTSLDYIENIFEDFIELHGDRNYGDDKAIICGIGKINNITVTIIGEQKGKNTRDNIERNFGMPHPEGYRKAIRFMKQAEKFKRPIIAFIDTPRSISWYRSRGKRTGRGYSKKFNGNDKFKSSNNLYCYRRGLITEEH